MPAGHAALYCFNEKLTKSNYSSGRGKVSAERASACGTGDLVKWDGVGMCVF